MGATKGSIYARTNDLCYSRSALLGPVSSRMRNRRLGGEQDLRGIDEKRFDITKLTQKERKNYQSTIREPVGHVGTEQHGK